MFTKSELDLIVSALDDFQFSVVRRKHDPEYINKIKTLKIKAYYLSDNLKK